MIDARCLISSIFLISGLASIKVIRTLANFLAHISSEEMRHAKKRFTEEQIDFASSRQAEGGASILEICCKLRLWEPTSLEESIL